MTHQALANAFGVTRNAITKHVKAGMPTESLEAAKEWYVAHTRGDSLAGMGGGGGTMQQRLAEARLARELADARLKNTKAALLEGETVRMDVALKAISVALAHVAGIIDHLPDSDYAGRANPENPRLAREVLRDWVETVAKPSVVKAVERGEGA